MSRMNVAWSHSVLNSYETCAWRHYLTKVAKTVKEPPSDAMNWGRRVHTSLEQRLKHGTALPTELRHYEKYAAKLLSFKGKRIIEEKMSIDKAFRPDTWFSKTVWCRSVIDFGVIGTDQALILDWKTGKRKPDFDQLKLFAGVAFAHYPWVDKVTTGFIWLKEKKWDQEKFTRSQVGDIWSDFLPRVKRLEQAYAEDRWPKKPSGLCREWCPVGQGNCEFCGR